MRRALITGAGGFVGSHLVDRLLTEGFHVTGLDVLPPPLPERLSHLEYAERFEYRQMSVTDDAFASWVAHGRFDLLCHLAAAVGVERYCRDPLGTIEVIVIGTRNVIRGVQGHDTRVLFASSSEVYGRNPDIPWREDSERILGPTWTDRWVYSSAKALCEHMLFAASTIGSGFPLTVVRYFNVYGPRQGPHFVIPAMVQRVLGGRPSVIYDTGKQTRCFTYVEDAIEGTVRAVISSAAVGEAFNLGSNQETTIEELANLILRLTASSQGMRPEFVDGRDVYGSYEDISRRVPDTSKAQRILGWQATTPLREGLLRTIEYFRKGPGVESAEASWRRSPKAMDR